MLIVLKLDGLSIVSRVSGYCNTLTVQKVLKTSRASDNRGDRITQSTQLAETSGNLPDEFHKLINP